MFLSTLRSMAPKISVVITLLLYCPLNYITKLIFLNYNYQFQLILETFTRVLYLKNFLLQMMTTMRHSFFHIRILGNLKRKQDAEKQLCGNKNDQIAYQAMTQVTFIICIRSIALRLPYQTMNYYEPQNQIRHALNLLSQSRVQICCIYFSYEPIMRLDITQSN